ncbi:MAG: DUF485 domain-containing protein [Pseudomonadota bacterium]
MTRDTKTLEAAHASIRALIAAKLKYLVPMTIIFVVGYIGLTVLAGFAKDLLGTKIAGGFNLGFALITFNYLLSWGLAIVYVRVANDVFDPLAHEAATALIASGEAA